MELINFPGLNCYHNCIVTLAGYYGIEYPLAFSTLWSETDFKYETYREVYLTRRLIENLESLGLKLDISLYPADEGAGETLSGIDDGELIIVGMDAFYIPWNQFYKTFHGPHYFIAVKDKSGEYPCFDPTYGKKYERISAKEVSGHAFDLSRTTVVVPKPWGNTGAAHEALKVLRTHGETRERILSQIANSAHKGREDIISLAKYADAMINNRYLFRHYLREKPALSGESHLLFDRDYFSKWKTVKNGLYKAAAKGDSGEAMREVCGCFAELMDQEINIAEKMTHGNV